VKRIHAERIQEIVNLWILFLENTEEQERIAMEGSTLEGKAVDFGGDIPQSGAYKPEALGAIVDRQRKVIISEEMKQAKEMIFSLPLEDRDLITLWPQLKGETNTVTQRRYTQRDVSLALSIPPEFFLAVRENSCMKLITVDMIKNPHMYINKNKTTLYAKSA